MVQQPGLHTGVLTRLAQSSPLSQQPSSRRFLSTYSSQRLHAAQSPSSPPSQATPPPTTSPPSSPNDSLIPPTGSDQAPPPPPPGPSTAQMQKHITSNLPSSRPSLTTKLAKSLRTTLPSTTSTYLTYGLTELLFSSCSAHTAYIIHESQRTQILTGQGPPKTSSGEDIGQPDPPLPTTETSNNPTRTFFFSDLGLLPTFSTWSQTTFLHMYLLTVYLRALPQPNSPQPKTSIPGTKTTVTATSFQTYQQYLLEHFSQLAEVHMMTYHTITARGIRNRYLKDLFIQWRGILAAYDQGLVEGDAVLASAVWRNMFKGEEDVDWVKVAMVVAYMRKAIGELEKVRDVQELPRRLDGKGGVWARSLEGVRDMVGREGSELRHGVD